MRKWIVGVLAASILAPTLACGPEIPTKDDPVPAPVTTAAKPPSNKCLDRLPGDPPDLDNKRYVIVFGCVEDGFQPLELITSARDLTTGQYGEHSEPSAFTEVKHIIGYDTGHSVQMHVELKPSRPGSQDGVLYISDGEGNRKILQIKGGWKAVTDFQPRR